MARSSNVSRRSFLAALGLGGGGLVLGVALDGLAGRRRDWRGRRPPTFAPNVFLAIDPTGLVRIVAHRSEMGQGIRTSTTMIVADELEADWARVRVVQAEGDEKKYGDQNTDGSHSIRGALKPLREAGAAARMMLEIGGRRAVERAGRGGRSEEPPRSSTPLADGRSTTARSRRPRGPLPVPAPATLKLKPKSAFRYIGKITAHRRRRATSSPARAVFGIDATLPGMKYAVIARPPVYGGKLVSVDSAEALKVPGVEQGRDARGRASAVRVPAARRRRRDRAEHVGGDAGPRGAEAHLGRWPDTQRTTRRRTKAALVASASTSRARSRATKATSTRRCSAAATLVAADYYVPHLAHSSIEPPAALANVTADGCQVWACTQGPQGARDELASALGPPAEKVTVNVTLLGGGFGRKSKPDFVVEAALLSKAVGAPGEGRRGRARTRSSTRTSTPSRRSTSKAALDARGKVTSWLHRTALPVASASIFAPNVKTPRAGELGLGFVDVPYAIPNIRIEACDAEARTCASAGSGRCRTSRTRSRSRSFVDELAHAAKRDPRDFLLELHRARRARSMPRTTDKYGNYGGDIAEIPDRHRRGCAAVIEAAAAKAGWGRKLPARHGPRHRRAPQLPHLRLHGRRSGGGGRRDDLGSRASSPRSTAAPTCTPDRITLADRRARR